MVESRKKCLTQNVSQRQRTTLILPSLLDFVELVMVSAQFLPQCTMIILSHYHENPASASYRE